MAARQATRPSGERSVRKGARSRAITWPDARISAGRAIATLFLTALLLLPVPVPFASAAVPDPSAPTTDRPGPEAEPGDDGDTTEPGDAGDTGETGGTEREEARAPDPGDGEAKTDTENVDAANSLAPARNGDVPDGRGRRDSRRSGDGWDVETGRVADPDADPLDGDPPAADESSGEGSNRDRRSANDDASPSRIWPMRPGTFTFTQPFGCVPQLGGYYEVDAGCPSDQPAVHTGIDLAAPTGTRIYAAAAGWVTEAGLDRPSGLANSRIVIQHEDRNDDFATEYLHWSVAYVRAGDYVRAGEPIAEVGSVGYSTGPHLHLSVVDFRTDERIDPVRWLPDDEASTEYRGLPPNRRPLRVRAQNKPVPDYADPNPAPVPEREPVPETDGDERSDDDSDRGGGRSSDDDSGRDGKGKGRVGRGDGDSDGSGERDRGRRGDKRSGDDRERGDRRGRGGTREDRPERGGDDRTADAATPTEGESSDGGRRGRSRSDERDRAGRDRERGGDRSSDRAAGDDAGRLEADDDGRARDEDRQRSDRDRNADAGDGGTDAERNGIRGDGARKGGRNGTAEEGDGTATLAAPGVLLPPPVPAVPPVPPPVPPPSQAASEASPAAEASKDRQRSTDGDQATRRRDGS